MEDNMLDKIIVLKIAGEEKMIEQTQIAELIEGVRVHPNLVMAESYKATELGKRLSSQISGQKVNKLLQELGYQVKKDNKWQVTDEGAKYAVCKPYFRQSQKSIWIIEFEILWNKSVVEALEDLLIRKEKKVA